MIREPDTAEHWRVSVLSPIVIVQDFGDDAMAMNVAGCFYDPASDKSLEEAKATALRIAALSTLERAVYAAMHALRSYEFGNAATDLAGSVADACEAALKLAGRE